MIRVVGAGPGHRKFLTLEALELIKTADKVVGFKRIAEDLKDIRSDIIAVEKVSELLQICKSKDEYILILASGDPMFFGSVEFLKKNEIEIESVHPGLSSISYLFSKLQMPSSYVKLASLHGREFDFLNIDGHHNYAFLIDGEKGANYISEELYKLNFKGKLYCGYNLSYADEELIELEIGEEIIEPSILGVVVTKFYVD